MMPRRWIPRFAKFFLVNLVFTLLFFWGEPVWCIEGDGETVLELALLSDCCEKYDDRATRTGSADNSSRENLIADEKGCCFDIPITPNLQISFTSLPNKLKASAMFFRHFGFVPLFHQMVPPSATVPFRNHFVTGWGNSTVSPANFSLLI